MNVTFHPNGTLSSQLAKTLFLIREESIGPDTDLITTLNVPMIVRSETVDRSHEGMGGGGGKASFSLLVGRRERLDQHLFARLTAR